MCGKGDAQSPIILPAIEDDKVMQGDLEMKGYEAEIKKFLVDVDKGHAINVAIKEETLPYLTGKNTVGDEKFFLKAFHFHLGSDDTRGSEHTIEGVTDPFPTELHFVHLKAGKEGLEEALDEPSSAVVLSVLYKADDAAPDEKADAALNAIIDKIGIAADATQALVMSDFIGPLEKYFFYIGSITTPPCTQGIKWVVLDTHPVVRAATLKKLRESLPSFQGQLSAT
uniref:carbonic anhydrase n=1 Tax=Amblyomma maculatum TaxID=34609 RepID=G3MPX3_AMBMU